jgi:hypothetical protein
MQTLHKVCTPCRLLCRPGENPLHFCHDLIPRMANLSKHCKYRRYMFTKGLSMRLLPQETASLSAEVLDANGYYRGFPCPLGHTIRDKEKHWCYHCAVRIQSNICCFDVNYLLPSYQVKALSIWSMVEVRDKNECWPIKSPGQRGKYPDRVCMPSYRSNLGKELSGRINITKALYTMCWGDIGRLNVTHTCEDPWCANPLHLTSSWNRSVPPRTMSFFELDYDPKKLMQVNKWLEKGATLDALVEAKYKMTIADPKAQAKRREKQNPARVAEEL